MTFYIDKLNELRDRLESKTLSDDDIFTMMEMLSYMVVYSTSKECKTFNESKWEQTLQKIVNENKVGGKMKYTAEVTREIEEEGKSLYKVLIKKSGNLIQEYIYSIPQNAEDNPEVADKIGFMSLCLMEKSLDLVIKLLKERESANE